MNVIELKPRARGDKSGFVYVLMMLAPEGPVFKIGKAINVAARMEQIQPLLPYDSIVLFQLWSPDVLAQEAYLHRYYSECRLLGEWFRLALGELFALEELGAQMAASTPPEHLDRPTNWRIGLFYNAPSLLARMIEEFPDRFSETEFPDHSEEIA